MIQILKSMFRQPILHFLLLGGLLFWVYDIVRGSDTDTQSNRIIIRDQEVLNFIQYRNRAFNEEAARAYYKDLEPKRRGHIVNQLVHDEALYRESLKLGLNTGDYVIKQRLIQKMEYLARGFDLQNGEIGENELKKFFDENQESYRTPPIITFAHVFVDGAGKGREAIQDQSEELLSKLNEEQIPFFEATRFGDRFLYHTNYVERSREYVESHFGRSFAEEVMQLSPDTQHWAGPILSKHGLHMLLVTKKHPGGVPELNTIRGRVLTDARQARLTKHTEKVIQEIIGSYDVEVLVE